MQVDEHHGKPINLDMSAGKQEGERAKCRSTAEERQSPPCALDEVKETKQV